MSPTTIGADPDTPVEESLNASAAAIRISTRTGAAGALPTPGSVGVVRLDTQSPTPRQITAATNQDTLAHHGPSTWLVATPPATIATRPAPARPKLLPRPTVIPSANSGGPREVALKRKRFSERHDSRFQSRRPEM